MLKTALYMLYIISNARIFGVYVLAHHFNILMFLKYQNPMCIVCDFVMYIEVGAYILGAI